VTREELAKAVEEAGRACAMGEDNAGGLEMYAQEALALFDALASEREARERAEREVAGLNEQCRTIDRMHDEETARREQAERERDEAREELEEKIRAYDCLGMDFTTANEEVRAQRYRADTAEGHLGREKVARERAEAELATMKDAFRALIRLKDGAEADNAALLEELRALRKVRDEVVAANGQDAIDTEWAEAIMSHVRAADALRGKE
jgi:chromosome segregation ATPase